ncbi:MAG: hypothetical protein DMF88_06005 [Acidobacteria bacterium]|nr:MAG: hypothetical protein DMF88_06005 [Acidobacteriota bacterium]
MKIATALLLVALAAPAFAQQHPDLSGIWIAGNRGIRPAGENASIKVLLPLEGVNQDKDNVFAALDRISVTERAKDQNVRQSQEDPAFYCKPAGVPRMGPPAQIVQLPDKVVFLYATNLFRLIPIGAAHRADIDTSYMGDSVAKWDGDTLVVDVNNLNDDTWLGPDGYFHTEAMHVTERFTRNGDTMTYLVTVEDPNVFTRPWNMNPRTLRLGTRPLEEGPPCVEKDAEHLVTLDHH